jgi:hypothetical protein
MERLRQTGVVPRAIKVSKGLGNRVIGMALGGAVASVTSYEPGGTDLCEARGWVAPVLLNRVSHPTGTVISQQNKEYL